MQGAVLEGLAEGRARLSGRGRRRLEAGHPWIFADDVAALDGPSGALVVVEDPSGRAMGWALSSRESKLCLRTLSRGRERPDRDFFARAMARALEVRSKAGLLDPRGACRLLQGDSENVPGLVVDRYADVLVFQSGTLAADRLLPLFLELVREQLPFGLSAAVSRSDASVRALEQLEPRVECLYGEWPEHVLVREGELELEVDVRAGHKTGHYLDQRQNRRRAAELARGTDVLDAFCYDGWLGLWCAQQGARSVLCLDQSQTALDRLQRNAARNRLQERLRAERVDAMSDLRERERRGERFDLVALDPPAFARNRRELEGAQRGYKELNLRAMSLLNEGGTLVSSSCSYALKAASFVEILAAAAADAGRDAFLVATHGADVDHPVRLGLPESAYLKCAFVRMGAACA